MTTRKDLSRTSPTQFPPIHRTLNLEEWKPQLSRRSPPKHCATCSCRRKTANRE